ncbi:MAG: YIP1 family protein, partial [Anaerolineales bacterium]|nr:YIP1 family protein [Anaerolineales bacterium]
VFKLDANTFEDIEHDQSATSQAAMVVLAVALFSAIGGSIGALIGGNNLLIAFIGPIISSLVGWIVWSAAVYFVGTSFFGGTANMGEMMRVVGFAYAPQLLGLISFIPCVGWLIALSGWIWSLAAMVVAIRHGLDVDTSKALITALVGWILVVIIYVIVSLVFGGNGGFGSFLTG